MNDLLISAVEDLKKAIKMMRTSNAQLISASKSEDKDLNKNSDRIQYLGRKEVVNGLIKYFIKDNEDGAGIYNITVDLKKKQKPISVYYINHKNGTVKLIDDDVADLKKAVQSIYNFLGGRNGQ